MSYFSIEDFIESGEKSLKDKNYWSALSVALALPSMCSRVMYQDDKYKGSDRNDSNGYWYKTNNGEIRWHDKKCYIDFCQEVMRVNKSSINFKEQYDMWLIACLGLKFADVLYQLRCDIIHSGMTNIYDDGKGIYLMLGENQPATEMIKYRIVPIESLCRTLFLHIKNWCSSNSVNNFKYTYVFDNEHSQDDRLLYNRLCDNDRADYLLEQFEKENAERNGTNLCKSQKQK